MMIKLSLWQVLLIRIFLELLLGVLNIDTPIEEDILVSMVVITFIEQV